MVALSGASDRPSTPSKPSNDNNGSASDRTRGNTGNNTGVSSRSDDPTNHGDINSGGSSGSTTTTYVDYSTGRREEVTITTDTSNTTPAGSTGNNDYKDSWMVKYDMAIEAYNKAGLGIKEMSANQTRRYLNGEVSTSQLIQEEKVESQIEKALGLKDLTKANPEDIERLKELGLSTDSLNKAIRSLANNKDKEVSTNDIVREAIINQVNSGKPVTAKAFEAAGMKPEAAEVFAEMSKVAAFMAKDGKLEEMGFSPEMAKDLQMALDSVKKAMQNGTPVNPNALRMLGVDPEMTGLVAEAMGIGGMELVNGQKKTYKECGGLFTGERKQLQKFLEQYKNDGPLGTTTRMDACREIYNELYRAGVIQEPLARSNPLSDSPENKAARLKAYNQLLAISDMMVRNGHWEGAEQLKDPKDKVAVTQNALGLRDLDNPVVQELGITEDDWSYSPDPNDFGVEY